MKEVNVIPTILRDENMKWVIDLLNQDARLKLMRYLESGTDKLERAFHTFKHLEPFERGVFLTYLSKFLSREQLITMLHGWLSVNRTSVMDMMAMLFTDDKKFKAIKRLGNWIYRTYGDKLWKLI